MEKTVLDALKDIVKILSTTIEKCEKYSDGFVKNLDGTVFDKSTGLVWGPTFDKEITFEAAEKACKDFDLGGHKDWRLPTVKELASLVYYDKRDPAIDKEFFPDTKSSHYWTSTPFCSVSDGGWVVYFGDGYVSYHYRYYSYYVRPVRSCK